MRKRKKLLNDSDVNQKTVAGFGWYTPQDWEIMKSLAVDSDDLDDTYIEWLQNAQNTFNHLRELGAPVEKTYINANELIAWCKAENRPINSASRSKYAALLVDKKYNGEDK